MGTMQKKQKPRPQIYKGKMSLNSHEDDCPKIKLVKVQKADYLGALGVMCLKGM
jgi:hypothetical protein